jgi:hypothetical protein
MDDKKSGSIASAILWMFVLSLLLFWLPFVGSLIAGVVGGMKARTLVNAVLAVFLPGLFFGALLFFFATALTGIPLLGAIAGAGGTLLAFAHVGPLLLGAVVGALVA